MFAKFRSIGLLLVLTLVAACPAQVLPPQFSVNKGGGIGVMDIQMYPIQYTPGWKNARHVVDPSFTNQDNVALDGWEFSSELQTADSTKLNLAHRILSDVNGGSIDWSIKATATQPISTQLLALCIDLPVSAYADKVLQVNDQAVTLTGEASTNSQVLALTHHVTKIQIPTAKGPVILEGDWDAEIQDRRRWKSKFYSIRLYFSPSHGKITQSSFALKVAAKGYTCYPLSFEDQCNMGFKDDRAGDQVGGWSDQGSENDLSAMKAGTYVYGGIQMNVIDPAKNNGKSCMMFDYGQRPYFLKTARVNVPNNTPAQEARTLFMLHSSAWGNHAGTTEPVSIITAHYADGSTHDIPIMFGKDLGDWWGANSKSNACVVWSAPNGQAFVGAYLSRFELPAGKKLDYLTIQSNSRCVWGVIAMTLCAQDAPLPSEQYTPLIITEGKSWKKIDWTQEVEPGSILDFSTQYPQHEIGEEDRIVVRGRHFEYENQPGKPVRLHGVNLVADACFPEHKDADRIARQIQMRGFNIVRLHHFGSHVVDNNAPNSHMLDPENRDKICYLISQLKKHGIYVTWDLYTNRHFRAEDSLLNRPYYREIKILYTIDPIARKALTDFAQQLLGTVNPYTGMPLATDPVLATTSTMNEDMLMKGSMAYPDITAILHERYAQWVKANHPTADPNQTLSPLYTRFIYEMAVEGHTALQDGLKQLGVRTPFTGNNADKMLAANKLNDIFDYVDLHFYHDHPSFVEKRWSLPYAFSCSSATRQGASAFRGRFATRRIDKPYAITEYNHVMPNPYRAEAGALIGAYAAFQDWDMLCRFQWGQKLEDVEQPRIMSHFSIANDPTSILSEQIESLLFRRGDVATAKRSVTYIVDTDDVFTKGKDRSNYSDDYARLGLVTGVGNLTRKTYPQNLPANCDALVGDAKLTGELDGKLPLITEDQPIIQRMVEQGILSPAMVDEKLGRYTSDTQQLQINAGAGTFQAVTPRSEVVVLAQAGSLQANLLGITEASGPVTLCLSAMDGNPIATSKRLLLMHLTNTLNTQMKFRDQQGRILEEWGRLPLLVKKGTADLTLELKNAAQIKVYAVNLAGQHIKEMQTTVDAQGRLIFTADTYAVKSEGVMAYELICP